jgi:hypothetical protein
MAMPIEETPRSRTVLPVGSTNLFPETVSGGRPTVDGDANVRETKASGASHRAARETLMFASRLHASNEPPILVDDFGVAAACSRVRV